MRVVLLVVVFLTLAACKKSTCESAVNRMVECKLVVGGLMSIGEGGRIVDNANGMLRGACDAAMDSGDESKRKVMECAAAASSCDELAKCE